MKLTDEMLLVLAKSQALPVVAVDAIRRERIERACKACDAIDSAVYRLQKLIEFSDRFTLADASVVSRVMQATNNLEDVQSAVNSLYDDDISPTTDS